MNAHELIGQLRKLHPDREVLVSDGGRTWEPCLVCPVDDGHQGRIMINLWTRRPERFRDDVDKYEESHD